MSTNVLTLILNVLTAIGTVGAVFAALFIAYRQRAESLQTQFDAQRPIIVPESPATLRVRGFQSDPAELPAGDNFNFAALNSVIRIKNVGAGVATDVRGIIVGPEPPEPESVLPEHHSLDIAAPISAGESLAPLTHRSAFLLRGTVQVIPGVKLYAPREPTADEVLHGESRIEYRLTLSYHDIFGHIHAAAYDHTSSRRWRAVRVERSVTKSLDTLDHEARVEGIRFQKLGTVGKSGNHNLLYRLRSRFHIPKD